MSERHHWVGFNIVRRIGPAKFRALLDFFGSAQAAWQAPPAALEQTRLDGRALKRLLQTRDELDLPAVVAEIEAAGITILTWDDEGYPPLLKEIADPPPVLYLRGQLAVQDEWAMAVVGTRKATTYGKHVAQELVADLARSGVTVVSGLARGIDGIAHQAALDAGGRTIAVLGSGIQQVYPPEHRRLAQQITTRGAVISDFPPDTPPEPGNFPAATVSSAVSHWARWWWKPMKRAALSSLPITHWNRDATCLPCPETSTPAPVEGPIGSSSRGPNWSSLPATSWKS